MSRYILMARLELQSSDDMDVLEERAAIADEGGEVDAMWVVDTQTGEITEMKGDPLG